MNPTVETSTGTIEGRRIGEVDAYLGVPYGAPTGGAGRFRPPAPPPPWTGVRDCSEYGPSCPQIAVEDMTGRALPDVAEELMGVLNHERHVDEDCLRLNVWTPAAARAERRPVVVWLHGGGMSTGSASWPLYDFTNLARRHDLVAVGVNHRLGVLGFLDLSDLGPTFEESGNAGMLDIVTALAWVRDNIARFGGDPDNVTVFGESGGGAKTVTLLAMPAAVPLFHKAVVMSGVELYALGHEAARATSAEVASRLGVDRAALEQAPWQDLVSAEAGMHDPSRTILPERVFGPVLTPSLPRHPIDAIRAGSHGDIQVMLGYTSHEMLPFLDPDDLWDLDWVQVRDRVAAVVGGGADDIVDRYRHLRPEERPTAIYISIVSDFYMRVPHIRLADALLESGGPAPHAYVFTWGFPGPDGVVRASHGTDMPFFFDNLDKAPVMDGDHGRALADSMSGALAAFATTGTPGHAGLPAWPAYSLESRDTMALDTRPSVVRDPMGEERRLWDGHSLRRSHLGPPSGP